MLEATQVTKRFGAFVANDAVDLSLRAGTIHALLGENGAGKSTLVKCFLGVHRPDGGRISWKGAPVSISNPTVARRLGIGMVFQHFALFDALDVVENVAVSMPSGWSLRQVAEALGAVSDRYGLRIEPSALVADLSAGERQRVEIVRCLMLEPECVILDEPTSVLTPQEAEELFRMLRQIRDEGRAILYISHKLEEVQRLCETATILRHGKVVATCAPASVEKAELARLMVGEAVEQARPAGATSKAAPLVAVSALSAPAPSLFGAALKDISFELPAGQVSAIAGIAGNGQAELFSALSGETPAPSDAVIRFFGDPVGRLGIVARRRLGADFVSEERLGHGAAPDFSLSENVMVTRARTDAGLMRSGMVDPGAARSVAERIRAAFDVRSGQADPPARALSGGNLQKFVVGRAVDRPLKILIVNQPTWGVDAGAAGRIRRTLVELAASGAAVLVISQDLDEIYEIADRIAVLSAGALTAFHPAAALSRERIGVLMSEADGDAA